MSNLRLYIVNRVGDTDYDEYAALLIAATSQKQCIKLTENKLGDNISLEYIGTARRAIRPGILMEDFRAG